VRVFPNLALALKKHEAQVDKMENEDEDAQEENDEDDRDNDSDDECKEEDRSEVDLSARIWWFQCVSNGAQEEPYYTSYQCAGSS